VFGVNILIVSDRCFGLLAVDVIVILRRPVKS
jgi:hypothetical protein